MSVPQHLLGVKGDECQCGRRASVMHCPQCGSTRIYGFARTDLLEKPDGSIEKIKKFRCLRCAEVFSNKDINPEFCQAPPATRVLAAQRARAMGIPDGMTITEIAQTQELAEHIKKVLDPNAPKTIVQSSTKKLQDNPWDDVPDENLRLQSIQWYREGRENGRYQETTEEEYVERNFNHVRGGSTTFL